MVYVYGFYAAYSDAQKACLKARLGEPADQARTQLRGIAAARGVEVRESGERTSAVFRWMFSDVAACSFVSRDGKVIEYQVGSGAVALAR